MAELRVTDPSRLNRSLPVDYYVERDWSDQTLNAVIHHSREDAIRRWTPRDEMIRFTDRSTAEEWRRRNERLLYALYHAAELAGVIWYSRESNMTVHSEWTFAIRLYDSARGKGLAQPFMQASEQDMIARTRANSVWLETDAENATALHLYEKQGYVEVHQDNGRKLMIKEFTHGTV